jgi:nickel/cobalt transporter (NicO) family protein
MGRRLDRRLPASAVSLLAALGIALAIPVAAAAHPLGNFTINHYAGITVSRAVVHLDIVIDMAEIPAFQERQTMDTNGDGTVDDAEADAGAIADCGQLVDSLQVTRDGTSIPVVSTGHADSFPPGAGGLSTLRLECGFDAALGSEIAGPTTIDFKDASYAERIGWREIVAVADGVDLDSHGLPTTSPSQRLTAYPADKIALPLDVRSASLAVRPGGPPAASARPAGAVPLGAPVASSPAVGAVPGGVASELPEIFRTKDLTPLIILASLLTAVAIGAWHAVTPGHGKTLMAAYLVGSRGTAVHAVGLGLSVAVSHTLGILTLALVIVGAGSILPPDLVYRVTPVIAGGSIIAIGGWMLINEIRRRRRDRSAAMSASPVAAHDHGHDDHRHLPDERHRHEKGDGSSHEDHPHAHTTPPLEHTHGGVRHSHLPPLGRSLTWRGLFILGLAGGLVPSTSALVILIASIATGRPAFGLVLVVAFGVGMAAVMTGVGLAMIYARTRLDRMPSRSSLGRLAAVAPLVASVAVLGLGVVLTWQALSGTPAL